METIALASIRTDGGTQPRSTLDLDWVTDYGQDMIKGEAFPPIVVFYDGTDNWLADGFHRTEAAKAVGLAEIAADIRQGTRRDAVLFSVGANAAHGHRRTNDDKRRAVQKLLDDPEWVHWSDREIGRRCAVDHVMVGRLRPPPPCPADTGVQHQYAERTFVHPKTGRETTMNTSSIGRAAGAASAPACAVPAMPHQAAAGPQHTHAPANFEPEALPPASTISQTAEPETEPFDVAAADLHRDLMSSIASLATMPTPREAQDACNKHSGRGVLPSAVTKASTWLSEFAALYAVEEPIRVEEISKLFGVAA